VPRSLGPAAFGEYRLAEATAELLFVVLSFGIDAQRRREAAVDPARARAYLSGITLLRVGAGAIVILGAAIVLWATGSSQHVLLLFALMGLAQTLTVLNNSCAAFEHAAGDVRWIARINAGSKAVWAAAVLGVLAAAPAGIAVAAVGVVVEAVRFAWLSLRGIRRHGWAVRPDLGLATVAIGASVPFFVNSVAHSLYARVGTGWVAAVTTEFEVGLYGAAGNLASIALLAMPLISWVLVPSAARAAAHSAEELDRLVANALRVCLLVMVPIAVACSAGAAEWIHLVFGATYLPAAPVLRILAPTFALAYASTICAIGLIQQGRIWTVANVSIAGVAVTMLLDMLLVPWGARHLGPAGGAQGAAWATLATEALVTLALAWAGRSVWRDPALQRSVRSLAAGLAAAAAVAAVLTAPGMLRATAAVAAFVAALIMTGGIDRQDVRFCRRAVRRGSPAQVPATVEVS
jgi:O-antigen/teichoic acid export membrane protein